jgi:molybdopterin-biosynthesis enzyme MoeA-like protein
MVILPHDAARPADEQALFVCENLWVPIAVVNGNVHVLPGVPRLFEQLLDGLRPRLEPRLADQNAKYGHQSGSGGGGICRVLISTPLPESAVASYLTELAKRVGDRGVKVGSYPRWGKSRNTVTLVGRDAQLIESLVSEVEKAVEGRRVVIEGEDDSDRSDPDA